MKTQTSFSVQTGLVRLGLIFAFLVGLFSLLPQANLARAQVLPSTSDPTPPASTVKLIFIHHSTGENWLRDDYGGLGLALSQNNYFVSDTNYGWGPNAIGDRTDIPNWPDWFASADTPTIMSALYTEYGQHSSYTRTLADPGGENEIIMFKSCFPNSALEGNPTDPPSADGWLTVGHAKWVYNQILPYFGAHPEKLFIVITAPPLRSGTYAANARAFNQWLYYDWLAENNYTQANVAVFDFYNVLTAPGNHHYFNNGAEQHIIGENRNTLYYPSGGDDHPSIAGSVKATDEFIELLNVFYHRWDPSAPTCQSLTLTSNPAAGGSVTADPPPNCGATHYSTGSLVDLTPSANFGYTFSNWSGDATGSDNPLTITMDANKTVAANFAAAPVLPPDEAILHTNRPTFDWSDFPGAIGYQIQVSKNAAFTQLVVNSSPRGEANSTYTPASNLPANFTLYWRYRAKLSAFSYSPWSHVYTLQTANPPSIPTLSAPLNNALVTTTTPLLNWNNSTLPSGTFDKYEVEISSNNTFTAIVTTANVFGITNSEVVSPALLNGKTYYWRVRSLNTNGDFSGWSLVRSIRIAFAGPTLVAPSGAILTLKPTFTWDVILGATSYNLQVSKVNTFAPLVINRTVAASTYTHILNLAAGTGYYWRVRANGPYGPGTWSVTLSFTTP